MSEANPPERAGAEDPSMEDILASIRRILSEDEAAAASAAPADAEALPTRIEAERPAVGAAHDRGHDPAQDRGHQPAHDVLALDESMMVDARQPRVEPARPTSPSTALPGPARTPAGRVTDPPPMDVDADVDWDAAEAAARAAPPAETTPAGLIGPAPAAAASASIGSLLRTLDEARTSPVLVTRSGVTLEDVVRDELRPLLKAWLDEQLPPLVERMVRAEIGRLIGRAHDS